MKNIKLIAMIGAMGLAFAACEPALIENPGPFAPVESTVLANGITYTQYADEACTQPDEAGNFVKFSSAAGVVQVFVEGNTSPLFTGAGGVIKLPAKRGQEHRRGHRSGVRIPRVLRRSSERPWSLQNRW